MKFMKLIRIHSWPLILGAFLFWGTNTQTAETNSIRLGKR